MLSKTRTASTSIQADDDIELQPLQYASSAATFSYHPSHTSYHPAQPLYPPPAYYSGGHGPGLSYVPPAAYAPPMPPAGAHYYAPVGMPTAPPVYALPPSAYYPSPTPVYTQHAPHGGHHNSVPMSLSSAPLPLQQDLPNIRRLLDGIQVQGGGDVMADNQQQRCINCCNYFTEEHNGQGACVYHSGRYKTPDSVTPNLVPSAGNFKRWTCCRAFGKDLAGCKTGQHVGDAQTNALLQRFRPRASASDISSSDTTLESNDPSAQQRIWEMMREQIAEKKAVREQNQAREQDELVAVGPEGLPLSVTHRVLLTDTLAGVALKYGVKAGDIKRANNLIADSVFERKELTIPKPTRLPNPDEVIELPKSGKETIAICRFVQRALSSDKHEARYYLTEHDWDVERALAAYREDVEWAQRNPIKRSVA